MPDSNSISSLQDDMVCWRRDIHAHPETAYEEHRTSKFVADQLAQFGIEVNYGLAGTGVVGTLRRGTGPSIGLRADMDALNVAEANDFAHRSVNQGKMHACGHDGHTAMLLGAAKLLAEASNFRGTVQLIFQPAEEGGAAGARRMIEEGLFDKFPVDAIYGLHNNPNMPAGHFGCDAGPMMAASDTFEITLSGGGGHAAWPHRSSDAVLAAAALVVALQAVVSRKIDPMEPAVLTVTNIHGGSAINVMPEKVVIAGSARSLSPAIRDTIESSIHDIAENVASEHGTTATVSYRRGYPVLINHAAHVDLVKQVAADVFGADQIAQTPTASMGGEDFAFMLEARPGAYAWIGGGSTAADPGLHSPHFDFNDEILGLGARYWVGLVERALDK